MCSTDGLLPIAGAHQLDKVGRNQVTDHLGHVGQLTLALAEADAVDVGGQPDGLFLGAAVVTAEEFGQFLMEVEDGIGVSILARHRVGPQFLHEEDLVSKLRSDSCIELG